MRSTVDKKIEYNSINYLENELKLSLILSYILRSLQTLFEELQSALVEWVWVNLFFTEEFLVILMHHFVNRIGHKFLGVIKVNERNALSIFSFLNVLLVNDLLLEIGENMEKM